VPSTRIKYALVPEREALQGHFMSNPVGIEQTEAAKPCPCGSGKSFSDCCGPILSGKRVAADAEQLMRARFTAHAIRDFAFVHRTYRPTSKQPYVPFPDGPTTEWTRLVVHSHALGKTPDVATVEFSAYWTEAGAEHALQEKAEFILEGGEWIYTRPLREGPPPVRNEAPKTGRNDPCPCGSGKKYKHCCLAKA
jgi:SEC-C motif-containing protein